MRRSKKKETGKKKYSMSLKIRNESGKALDIWICIGDRKALGHIPEEKVTVKLNVPSGADALEYRYGKKFQPHFNETKICKI